MLASANGANSMTAEPLRLSKSKIAAFEHCPKRLWLQTHRRDLARHDQATLDRFKIGHEVGARACQFVPDGIMIEAGPDIRAALDQTRELMTLAKPLPLFEATFQHEDVLVRVDILEPVAEGQWRAIEVKASSRVKKYQVADIATQVWVMRSCGLPIKSAIIRHLAAPIDWRQPQVDGIIFRDTDVTDRVNRIEMRRPLTAAAARICVMGQEPQIEVGPRCRQPFFCEFEVACRRQRDAPLLHATTLR